MNSNEQYSDTGIKIVTQAISDWFRREPYVGAVFNAMPPGDRDAVIERVRTEAVRVGHLQMDAPVWLSDFVHAMHDRGQLPEVQKAQHALHAQAQAIEDNAIQTANLKDVQKYLSDTYRAPAEARKRAENNKQSQGPSGCL